jgi:hypothetical protein
MHPPYSSARRLIRASADPTVKWIVNVSVGKTSRRRRGEDCQCRPSSGLFRRRARKENRDVVAFLGNLRGLDLDGVGVGMSQHGSASLLPDCHRDKSRGLGSATWRRALLQRCLESNAANASASDAGVQPAGTEWVLSVARAPEDERDQWEPKRKRGMRPSLPEFRIIQRAHRRRERSACQPCGTFFRSW